MWDEKTGKNGVKKGKKGKKVTWGKTEVKKGRRVFWGEKMGKRESLSRGKTVEKN